MVKNVQTTQIVDGGDLGFKEDKPKVLGRSAKEKQHKSNHKALKISLAAAILILIALFAALFLLARAGRSSLVPVYTPPKDQVIRQQGEEVTPEPEDLENGAQRSQPIPSTGGR